MARKLPKNGADSKPKERKPRAKNAATSAAPVSNVTDDTIRELCLEALDKKTAHEDAVKEAKTANAEYRAVLKKAKKLGILPEVIIIWLNDRKLEVADVSNRLAQQNRVYELMKLPVGTQLGFNLEGKTIATAIEDQFKAADETDQEVYDTCHALGAAGKPLKDSGYDEDSKHWLTALRGYADGQRVLATEPGGLAAGAGEARPN